MTQSGRGQLPVEDGFVDLHMHSTASDGALPAAEVVAAAARANLGAIALTDHDTLAGVAEAEAAGGQLGVRVIPGVELSAHDLGEVHLLGLHISRAEVMEARLVGFRKGRRARAEKIVELLNQLGVPLSMASVLEHADTGAIGRPHVARALVSLRSVRDQREAFDRWLGAGKPAYVEKEYLGMRDAIALVHDSGGIAVLAHPGPAATRARLEELRGLGLDGVELRHPGYSAEDTARIGALARHLELLPSGGSDWHGASTGQRTIGCMNVPRSWLDKQDAFLRERGKRERVA